MLTLNDFNFEDMLTSSDVIEDGQVTDRIIENFDFGTESGMKQENSYKNEMIIFAVTAGVFLIIIISLLVVLYKKESTDHGIYSEMPMKPCNSMFYELKVEQNLNIHFSLTRNLYYMFDPIQCFQLVIWLNIICFIASFYQDVSSKVSLS